MYSPIQEIKRKLRRIDPLLWLIIAVALCWIVLMLYAFNHTSRAEIQLYMAKPLTKADFFFGLFLLWLAIRK